MADAALAAAIAGPTVGAVVVAAAYFNSRGEREAAADRARRQQAHDRQLAHDAYLREIRARVYEEVLRAVQYTMLRVERTDPPIGLQPDPPGQMSDEQVLEIEAKAAAFGSPELLAAVREFASKARAFFGYVMVVHGIERQGGLNVDAIGHRERAREEARSQLRAVEEIVRRELTTLPSTGSEEASE